MRLIYLSGVILLLTFVITGCENNVAESQSTVKPTKATKQTQSLHKVVADGDIEQVKLVISKGADVNAEDENENTPLYYAVNKNNIAIAKYLIDHGANVNAPEGWTALQEAPWASSTEMVELLIAKGADVNAGPYTALHGAISEGRRDIAELLIQKGADVNAKDKWGYPPLYGAIKKKGSDTAKLLIARGADIQIKDKKGYTPLHWSAMEGKKEVAEFLIAKGSDWNIKDNSGRTALHTAAEHGQKDVAELLVSKGADIDAKDKWGRTPLHFALVRGDHDVAQLLIAKGTDTEIHVMQRGKRVSFGPIEEIVSLNVDTEDIQADLSHRRIEEVELTFNLEPSDITIYPAPKGREYVDIKGLKPLAKKGVPQLPVKTFVVELEKESLVFGVKITEGKVARLSRRVDIVPAPGNDPYHNFYDPNKALYERNSLYPGNCIAYEEGMDNQKKFVFVRLFPLQYNAKQKEAYVITESKIVLYYGASDSFNDDLTKTPHRDSVHVRYDGGTGIGLTHAKNLIICPKVLKAAAEQLSDFHNRNRMKSSVVTTEEIASHYMPVEGPRYRGYEDESLLGRAELKLYNYALARRIVSYLRDMSVHPHAEYVTLIGDSLLIPPSYYLKGFSTRFPDMWVPTDFFYASPDYDIVPNLRVGRLSVDGAKEATHVVKKIKRWYESSDWEWFRKVHIASLTGHGYIYKNGERTALEPIVRGYFERMDVKTFLERNDAFNKQQIERLVSKGGVGFVYILTHGSYYSISAGGGNVHAEEVMGYSSQVNVPIVVCIGCSAGASDIDIVVGQDAGKSFGESVLISQAGGIAYIGSSRPGPGYPHIYFDGGQVRVAHLPYTAGILNGIFAAYHQGKDRLGDLCHETFHSFVRDNWVAGDEDNLRAMLLFAFLGDPALKIPAKAGNRN